MAGDKGLYRKKIIEYACRTTNQSFFSSFLQAYCFFGQDLLVQEKCGESIKVLQYSKACMFVCSNVLL